MENMQGRGGNKDSLRSSSAEEPKGIPMKSSNKDRFLPDIGAVSGIW